MDAAYADEYERFEREHWWFTVRRRIIAAAMDRALDAIGRDADIAGPRWLDVGCGPGVLLEAYRRVPPGRKVGTDPHAPTVARARGRGLDVRETATDWDFAALGAFDLVTLCDVLEHVERDAEAVAEVARRLRAGGRVVVTVPAMRSLWGPHDVVNHHFRRYRRGGLRRLFAGPLWEVERCTFFSSVLLPAIWPARQVRRLRPGAPGHDLKFGRLDPALRAAFGLEVPYLRRGGGFPAGSSLLLVARRTDAPAGDRAALRR